MTLFAVTEGVAFVWDLCPYNLCTQTWIAQGLPLQPDLLGNPRSDANCHIHQAVGRDMGNCVNSAEDKKTQAHAKYTLLCMCVFTSLAYWYLLQ
jgi:hypothetical protein